jgi:hypothetical protein
MKRLLTWAVLALSVPAHASQYTCDESCQLDAAKAGREAKGVDQPEPRCDGGFASCAPLTDAGPHARRLSRMSRFMTTDHYAFANRAEK